MSVDSSIECFGLRKYVIRGECVALALSDQIFRCQVKKDATPKKISETSEKTDVFLEASQDVDVAVLGEKFEVCRSRI
jgi:hypothetical protein